MLRVEVEARMFYILWLGVGRRHTACDGKYQIKKGGQVFNVTAGAAE